MIDPLDETNPVNANHPADDPLTVGRFETLCAHYGEHRLAYGSWLIRLHAGLEATEDLVNDVRQALED